MNKEYVKKKLSNKTDTKFRHMKKYKSLNNF